MESLCSSPTFVQPSKKANKQIISYATGSIHVFNLSDYLLNDFKISVALAYSYYETQSNSENFQI